MSAIDDFKIYLIATEPSGDVIGSNLIKSLKKIKNKKFHFYGIGGPKMIKSGLNKSLFPISELSIFGIFEIFPKIYKVLSLLNKTEKDIIKINPKVLITIDSPDFNFRILKKIYEKTPNIKKIHYVAPTVWAWRSGRARYLSKYIDKLLTILPFEYKYFKRFNLNTKFIGHPVYELNNKKKVNKKNLKFKYKIKNGYKIISFLPGSRLSELKRSLPVLIKTISLFKKQSNLKIHVLFYILPHLRKFFNKYKFDFPYSLINQIDKYDAFKISNAAISMSGTVAIELSYFKVPTLVIYKLNIFSYFLAKIFVKIKYANILNILENKYIIPEFLQFKCRPDLIYNELNKLLEKKSYSKQQISYAQKALMKLKKKNNKLPSFNAAKEIIL
tara:strand:+ start:2450 stop:3607 length:1158 start_codon:yes stop_codon:yes gene_type:complete